MKTQPLLTRVLFVVAVGGLGFQLFHVLEHLLQAGYWAVHPTEAPWLTPWAVEGRDLLAHVADGHAGSGNELLHLFGNVLFFGGLFALGAWRRRTGRRRGRTAMRLALALQGLHVVEHLLLTASWLVFDYTWGATTLFGLIPAGTVLAHAVRVWAHFGINALATAAALTAAVRCGAVAALWQRTGRPVSPPSPNGGPPSHDKDEQPSAGEESVEVAISR